MKPHTWKLTRKSAVCIVLSVAAVLCLMVVLSGIRRTAALERVSCQQEAADYLERIGWQVDRETGQVQSTVLPDFFDRTLDTYNQLQLDQGYDLREHRGQEIVIYTFSVVNYPNTADDVLACLLTCRNRVIGGDLHTAALDGFMHSLR